MSRPTISVIVINLNGQVHLNACFASLVRQDYGGPVELIMVDNGSQDSSVAFMRQTFPQVQLILNERNIGFAPAVNLAVRQATGKYIALINNDAHAAPDWLSRMVELAEQRREEGVVCVAARVLDWHGAQIDFALGGVNFHGFGTQPFFRVPTERIQSEQEPLLFANGGAMLVDREVFLAIGGFDDDFFAYFEDVDFGWRLWIAGYRVLLNPAAVVYHRHHSTAGTMYPYQTHLLYERNALMMMIKNYDDDHLQQVLSPALLLLIRRAVLEMRTLDRADFDLRKREGKEVFPGMEVPKSAISPLLAVDDLLKMLPRVYAKRAQIQAMRRRPDREILPLFRTPLSVNFGSAYTYNITVEEVINQFELPKMFSDIPTTRVLLLSADPLRPELAGTGIRAVEMARVLRQHCQVVLAAHEQADYPIEGVQTVAFSYEEPELIEHLVNSVDVILLQGFLVLRFPFLMTVQKPIIVDLYDPFVLSNLEFFRVRGSDHAVAQHEMDMLVLRHLLRLGDFFLCAGEEQRAYWLGALTMAGRLNPASYTDDRTLRRLIDLAPFGLSSAPPRHTQQVLKGMHPGIATSDTLLLWGGGIWEWFDPLTLLHAMAGVREQRPDIKLFFLGRGHPNTHDVPAMLMYERTLALADELGLRDHTVFFNSAWVPYAERQNYLLEADIGISTHFAGTETDFAFRTRLLDYFWAGLPMIVSSGDTLSRLVAAHDLGYVIAPGDVTGLAEAILALAAEPERKERRAAAMAAVREQFRWERTLEPLVNFCRNPYHAADAREHRPYMISEEGRVEVPIVQGSPALVRRMNDLDRVVEEKNAHIAYLESLIRQLESGRVMRMLNLVRKLRGRGE
jgi:hypothetical protein